MLCICPTISRCWSICGSSTRRGATIYLATGADTLLAERVAAHLGIFAGVLASDGSVNLTGHNKLAAFQERFPAGLLLHRERAAGCAAADPLRAADGGESAPQPAARDCVRPEIVPVRTLQRCDLAAEGVAEAIRLHQWAKNVLIFLPVLLAHVRAAGADGRGMVWRS